jgi:hypothetical protein
MDEAARRERIDKYKDGYRAVAEALADMSGSDLDTRAAPERWSVREIVHHLADSEMTAAVRLRVLLGSERPLIQGYDQEELARRLFYDRPIEASLEAFQAARRTTGEILDRMTADDWAREGTHSESGRYTVETWLEIYAEHAHKHADQILMARAAAR